MSTPSTPNSETHSRLTAKLTRARHNVRVMTVKALDPGLSAEKRAGYRGLERSFRAQVALALKALAHHGLPDSTVHPRS